MPDEPVVTVDPPSNIEVFVYRLRQLGLPQDERGGGGGGMGPPLLPLLLIVIVLVLGLAALILLRGRKKAQTG
jgi:hypothetical protein